MKSGWFATNGGQSGDCVGSEALPKIAMNWNAIAWCICEIIVAFLVGTFGSLLVIEMYNSSRSFEPDEERRKQDADAAGKLIIKAGLVSAAVWFYFRYCG